MLIMQSMTIPPHKLDDARKKRQSLAEKGEIPIPHIKIVGNYVWFDGESKVIQIIEIEKGYEDQVWKGLNKLLFQYRHIEGLKMKLQPLLTMEEGEKAF